MTTRPQFTARADHRARARLTRWVRAQPWRSAYWAAVDDVRAAQGKTVARWPGYAFLPATRANTIVGEAILRHAPAIARDGLTDALVRETMELAGLSAWRVTQGVYRFDPTIYAALIDTPLTGDLPAEVLHRLPEWCVYIETPGMTAPTTRGELLPVHGVYAWLDWEAKGDVTYLQLGIDLDDEILSVSSVPLVGTLDESIAAVEAEWADAHDRHDGIRVPTAGYAEAARRFLPPLISLVLYLCVDEADYGDRRPGRPHPTRTKDGWRLFPADRPTTWDVGTRLGAAIRHAQAHDDGEARAALASGRQRPRPHIRRAHFHGFWAGPKAQPDRQTLRVKWLPPIAVNLDDLDDLPTTVRDVKGATDA